MLEKGLRHNQQPSWSQNFHGSFLRPPEIVKGAGYKKCGNLESPRNSEFQQNQRFMEGGAMMESAADHNRAVYRRKEKAAHQVSPPDSGVCPVDPQSQNHQISAAVI